MVKINTDLGVNVEIENAPVPEAVGNVGSTPNIIGKSKFEQLADTFAKINPKLQKIVQRNLDEENLKQANLGAAKINGMTLEESKLAAKKGFPNIYNGWARYGAYKQYAINSVDGMVADFKDEYITKRNEPNYNWQEHYNEFSGKYLEDKADDEFFASAFNDSTLALRKWINVKEFEKEEEALKYRVIGNTSKSIQSIPEKVEQALEVAFYESNPPMTLGKNYQEKKQKFFKENMSKTYLSLFENIKANRNPALTLAEFDDIVISEAELHASLDGRFSAEFIEILTQPRPDGTPAIINNPKYQDRVVKLVDKLRDAIELQNNTANWQIGNVASMSKSDRKALGESIFDKEYRIRKSKGFSDADAFLGSVIALKDGMRRNEPITQIVELFQKPLSSEYTEDAKLALEVYAALDRYGMTGIYFKENDKNKFKFFVANVKMKAGKDPRDIIREMGTMDSVSKSILELNTEDKKSLRALTGNMAYAPNVELVEMVGQYFKNINDEANNNFIQHTHDFIEKHYTLVNGRWVSNWKMQQFGVTAENYDSFKVASIELLKEKLNKEKNIIQETDLVGFWYDETNTDVAAGFPKPTGVDLNDYELIVNEEGDTLYFKSNKDGTPLEVPATVEYKNGQTVWLELPISLVKDRVLLRNKEAEEKAYKLKMKKDKKARESKKKWKKLEDAEMEFFGQGQTYKF